MNGINLDNIAKKHQRTVTSVKSRGSKTSSYFCRRFGFREELYDGNKPYEDFMNILTEIRDYLKIIAEKKVMQLHYTFLFLLTVLLTIGVQ